MAQNYRTSDTGTAHGRIMVATPIIRAGELILTETPLIEGDSRVSPADWEKSPFLNQTTSKTSNPVRTLNAAERQFFSELAGSGTTQYGRVKKNSFSESNDDETSMIVRIFRNINYINHSCLPNAIVYYNSEFARDPVTNEWEGRGILRAVKKPAIGDEINICYQTDQAWTPKRIESLSKQYGFTCECPACPKGIRETSEIVEYNVSVVRRAQMQVLYTVLLRHYPQNDAEQPAAIAVRILNDDDEDPQDSDPEIYGKSLEYLTLLEEEGIVDQRYVQALYFAAYFAHRAKRHDHAASFAG
ncbi:hypothetical protein EJ08DRAFT_677537 [Tothia fuscella]|uniref:SET domain-containing protein n=1 Tax=Tothia fuscella TaxID=1048955 RepID=A0A9P4NUT5_9PEZI|nr:hypothetical protein EJ08DRAFT_677537 [Tothia fuscella]